MAAEIELKRINQYVSDLVEITDVVGAYVYGINDNGNSVKIAVSTIAAEATDYSSAISQLTQRCNGNAQLIAQLQNALTGKSNVGHQHAISDVNGLNTELSGVKDRLQALEEAELDIDTELSETSENPVQNKVIKAALDTLDDKIDNKSDSDTTYSAGDGINISGNNNAISVKIDNDTITLDNQGRLKAAPAVTVDSSLSETSENPVQNKIIKTELDDLQSQIDEKPDTDTTYSAGSGIEINASNEVSVKIDNDTITLDGQGRLKAAPAITVDSALSGTSTNPVQNKVVKAALDQKANSDTLTSEIERVEGKIRTDFVPKVDDMSQYEPGDGEIVMYNGETNENYENGAFYKYETDSGWQRHYTQPNPEIPDLYIDERNMELQLRKGDNVFSGVDLSFLAKDAVLQNAELITTPEVGVELELPYFKFTFNADSSTPVIRVSLAAFGESIKFDIDAYLSEVSENPVQNAVITAALSAKANSADLNNLQTAFNQYVNENYLETQLKVTSTKGVQNRIITAAVNDLQSQINSIKIVGGMKLVPNLDNYQGYTGEIVKYTGTTTQNYTHGYDYEFVGGQTFKNVTIQAGAKVVTFYHPDGATETGYELTNTELDITPYLIYPDSLTVTALDGGSYNEAKWNVGANRIIAIGRAGDVVIYDETHRGVIESVNFSFLVRQGSGYSQNYSITADDVIAAVEAFKEICLEMGIPENEINVEAINSAAWNVIMDDGHNYSITQTNNSGQGKRPALTLLKQDGKRLFCKAASTSYNKCLSIASEFRILPEFNLMTRGEITLGSRYVYYLAPDYNGEDTIQMSSNPHYGTYNSIAVLSEPLTLTVPDVEYDENGQVIEQENGHWEQRNAQPDKLPVYEEQTETLIF